MDHLLIFGPSWAQNTILPNVYALHYWALSRSLTLCWLLLSFLSRLMLMMEDDVWFFSNIGAPPFYLFNLWGNYVNLRYLEIIYGFVLAGWMENFNSSNLLVWLYAFKSLVGSYLFMRNLRKKLILVWI